MTKSSRLQQEIQLLRNELAMVRGERDELWRKHDSHFQLCSGCADSSVKNGNNPSSRSDRPITPNQDLYIAYLEEQIQRTRFKYKKQMGEVKCSASLLETKLQNVRMEMNYISAKAQKVDKLQKSINELKSKLSRRDMIISRYNEQHAAFLELINNLDKEPNALRDAPQQLQKIVSKSVDGCEEKRKDSVIRSRCKPNELLNFSCLSTALKNKLARK
ncbi:PREDICTED: uncharacterized protein LOC108613361 [Drosophila arizonae]|uniref:Uncharacterized protein LOC108613361 n=1 Tax=Drosophila arizonae TaxID=7263 RepID=A0ABM1P4W5_DROAR|nr:PREDICTED: uncharacterized protein LOC108613361 [Drosophila arizonae]